MIYYLDDMNDKMREAYLCEVDEEGYTEQYEMCWLVNYAGVKVAQVAFRIPKKKLRGGLTK